MNTYSKYVISFLVMFKLNVFQGVYVLQDEKFKLLTNVSLQLGRENDFVENVRKVMMSKFNGFNINKTLNCQPKPFSITMMSFIKCHKGSCCFRLTHI